MDGVRGSYRKCYIVPHGRGFKYVRAVPKDLRHLENKSAWVKCLGNVSRMEAETLAHGLAYEHGKRILAFRALKRGDPRSSNSAQIIELPTPVLSPAATAFVCIPPNGPTRSLEDLIRLWERVRKPRSPISRAKTRLCARRFAQLWGNIPAQDVTRDHAMAYRDALENLPRMNPENVEGHLTRMHGLFSVAMSEGLISQNPFQNVRVRSLGDSLAPRRQGFVLSDVKAIFAALEQEREDFAWVVRLLAYHGMRSGEACQLRCEDVTVLHGIPVLRIHDLYGSLKNRASVRDIPIHPACMGIWEKARAIRPASEPWLFPSLPAKQLGRGRWFQDYASRFLRLKVGIRDRRYTMHSFRHLWRTLARECEMPECVSRSIMGHTLGGGEHGAYGGAPSLKLRAEWMAKIDPLATVA